jgi:hypothetical protein
LFAFFGDNVEDVTFPDIAASPSIFSADWDSREEGNNDEIWLRLFSFSLISSFLDTKDDVLAQS